MGEVAFDEDAGRLTITRSLGGRGPAGIVAAVAGFALLWNVGNLAGPNAVGALVTIPVCVAVGWVALAAALNRARLTADASGIAVREGPVPVPGRLRRNLAWDAATTVRVAKRRHRRMPGHRPAEPVAEEAGLIWCVAAVAPDGARTLLLDHLGDEETAQTVARRIETLRPR